MRNEIHVFAIAHPVFHKRYKYINDHLHKLFGSNPTTVGVIGKQAPPESYVSGTELTPSQVGCALSHLEVYKRIIDGGLPHALVVEDDVILPSDISSIIDGLFSVIRDGEVIQIDNRKREGARLSSRNVTRHGRYRLHYPVSSWDLGGASAYIITRSAAAGILKANYPVQLPADNWDAFFKKDAFSTCRVLVKNPVKLKSFESTIWASDQAASVSRIFGYTLRLLLNPLLALRRRLKNSRDSHQYKVVDVVSSMPVSN